MVTPNYNTTHLHIYMNQRAGLWINPWRDEYLQTAEQVSPQPMQRSIFKRNYETTCCKERTCVIVSCFARPGSCLRLAVSRSSSMLLSTVDGPETFPLSMPNVTSPFQDLLRQRVSRTSRVRLSKCLPAALPSSKDDGFRPEIWSERLGWRRPCIPPELCFELSSKPV